MYLTFQHLVVSTDVKTPRQLYKMVISAFDSVILTTHKSKFVQFVVFFLCGIDASNTEHESLQQQEQSILPREFAAKLIELVLDPYSPTTTRQCAACYLASFVARSTSVCPETACEAVSAILRFAEAYMEKYCTEALARGAKKSIDSSGGGRDQASKISALSLSLSPWATFVYGYGRFNQGHNQTCSH